MENRIAEPARDEAPAEVKGHDFEPTETNPPGIQDDPKNPCSYDVPCSDERGESGRE